MNSDIPMMFGPDVFEVDPLGEVYTDLRKRANEMGFVTVGEALDWIEVVMALGAAHTELDKAE